MARVPLIDPAARPDLAPLAERIGGARRGKVINVYRALFNAPALAGTWFEHLNAVRWGTTLSGRLRELVIIRLGHASKAAYILKQHVPRLAEADGVSAAECAALADWRGHDGWTAAEAAALALTDSMNEEGHASDAVFAAAAEHFDPRAVTELVVLIGTYIMHARVFSTLALDLEQE